uniref:Uncharacterized protein n=1 Tax=Tanacetum cinerariifolium TaxID=118510 RepID=A0A699IJ31_TANCI|nr:hypothetical protein [Tanacetum cinerariifolium]
MAKHPSDTKVFTVKMEILLEPTSNKLLKDCNYLIHSYRVVCFETFWGTGLWDCNKVFDSDGFMSCNSVNYGFLSITLGKCLKRGVWDRYRVVLNVTYYMIIFASPGSISSGSWYKLWLDVELVKQSSSVEFSIALKVGSQLSMFKICAKICFDGMVTKS